MSRLTVGDLIPLLERHYVLGGYASAKSLATHAKPIVRILGHIAVDKLAWEDIEIYKQTRVKESLAFGTVNRELDFLSKGLNLAVEARLVDERQIPRVRRFRLDNARQGFVYPDEFLQIWEHLPPLVQDVSMFAYWSGWRKGEILRLTWDLVQKGVVRIRDKKSRTSKPAPLVGLIRGVIEKRREACVAGCALVFHRVGKQVMGFDKSWATAVRKSGLSRHIVLHDLRRSFVNNARQAGIDRAVIMKLTGHKTHLVFDRYNIVCEDELDRASRRIMGMDGGDAAA